MLRGDSFDTLKIAPRLIIVLCTLVGEISISCNQKKSRRFKQRRLSFSEIVEIPLDPLIKSFGDDNL